MFFGSSDELSEILHELKKEFEESGQKKFATRQIQSYDELSFQIAKRYIPKFNNYIKDVTGNQAEVLTNYTRIVKTRRDRDMFTDSDSEHTDWVDVHKVYLIWTGVLPSVGRKFDI